MVFNLDGLICGASENAKPRGLAFDCRRKTRISPLSPAHDKTKDNSLYFTHKLLQLFYFFIRIISAGFVDNGYRNFDLPSI